MSELAVDAREWFASLPSALRLELAASNVPDVRDPAWKDTTLGQDCLTYLRWKKNEDGAADDTILNRETVLVRLSQDHADMRLADFNGDPGTELLRAFLDKHWGDSAPSTRSNRTSLLRDLFGWAYREGMIDRDPMLKVRSPKRRGQRRDAHPKAEIMRLIAAQPRWRDRLGVALLGWEGLRKTELRQLQLGHFDFANRSMSVFGKGDKYAVVSPYEELMSDMDRYCQERAVRAAKTWRSEYLLFPERSVRRGSWDGYLWDTIEYRDRPMHSTTMQRWWRLCLERAGIDPFPMHEMRHSAGTIFHLKVGDYELTRQFLRHEDIATTAAYIHVPNVHVSHAKKRITWGDGE